MPTYSDNILGFDYGTKKIGIAVGLALTGQAKPLCIVRMRKQRPDWEKVSAIIKEWNPGRFVVGLSMHADNTESPVSVATKRFAATLAKKFNRPTVFVNEYLSSYAATFDNTRHGLDAQAAKVILETWLAENTQTEKQ